MGQFSCLVLLAPDQESVTLFYADGQHSDGPRFGIHVRENPKSAVPTAAKLPRSSKAGRLDADAQHTAQAAAGALAADLRGRAHVGDLLEPYSPVRLRLAEDHAEQAALMRQRRFAAGSNE